MDHIKETAPAAQSRPENSGHSLFEDAYDYGRNLFTKARETASENPKTTLAALAAGAIVSHGRGMGELVDLAIVEGRQLTGIGCHVTAAAERGVVSVARGGAHEVIEQSGTSSAYTAIRTPGSEQQAYRATHPQGKFARFFAAYNGQK